MTVAVTDKDIERAVKAYAEEYLSRLAQAPDGHVFSERYEKRKAQIIANGAVLARRTGAFGANSMRRMEAFETNSMRRTSVGARNARHSGLRRSIAAAVLVLAVAFGGVMAFSTTARAVVSNWLKETYSKLVKYEFAHTEDDHAYVICTPGQLPQGFERTEYARTESSTLYVYENAETGGYLRFEYSKATDALKAEIEKQSADAEILTISGSAEKYFLAAEGACRAFWYDAQRQLVFFVDSSLGSEALAVCLNTISIRLPLYEPAWLPEGYAEAERIDAYPWVSITWQNGAGEQLKLEYQDMSEADSVYVWSGGDTVASKPVEMGGPTGTYYPASTHETGSGMVWVDEEQNIIFIINADALEEDELITFAQSVRCTETDR